MKNNSIAPRDSSIELLRIVLMLMIIGFHLIVHGAKMGGPLGEHVIDDASSLVYVFLKSFLVIAVNCFVFISGFYRITFKIKTFLNLLLQGLFYSLAITIAVDMMSLEHIGANAYKEALFSVFSGKWWFLTAYLGLYLLSPLLNKAIDGLDKQQFLFIIIGVTVINNVFGLLFGAGPIVGANNGYSVLGFVHIYLIAQYISRYTNLDRLTKYSPAIYLGSSLMIFLLAFISITQLNQKGISILYAYNNPLVLIAAISFFFSFKNLQFRNGIINSISPYMLGVYLFHDHSLTRKYLIEHLFHLSQNSAAYVHFLSLLLVTLLVFSAGYLADRMREFTMAPVTQYVVQKFNLARIESVFNEKPKASPPLRYNTDDQKGERGTKVIMKVNKTAVKT